MSAEHIPDPVTEQERWIVKHHVDTVKVQYLQTGTLIAGKDKVTWLDSTFNKVAQLQLGYKTVVSPRYGVRERVEARDKWEKANARELAEFKRLKAKFEKEVPDGRG